ncbi:MAG: inosine-5-monophosphate dehydrogenase [Rhizobiales bacterium]|nr:inosine-5-monophosphate dehydrogenase [Hyphomicrobiales bacterium]
MTVKQIRDEKGRKVVTVHSSMNVLGAARFLAENKIGAVIVSDDGTAIHGILSERDIVRCLASSGTEGLDLAVSAIMTRDVVTCGEAYSVHQVMETMTRERFRHLPVTEKGKLVGIISIGDVVRRRIEQVEREAEEIKAYIAS